MITLKISLPWWTAERPSACCDWIFRKKGRKSYVAAKRNEDQFKASYRNHDDVYDLVKLLEKVPFGGSRNPASHDFRFAFVCFTVVILMICFMVRLIRKQSIIMKSRFLKNNQFYRALQNINSKPIFNIYDFYPLYLESYIPNNSSQKPSRRPNEIRSLEWVLERPWQYKSSSEKLICLLQKLDTSSKICSPQFHRIRSALKNL